MTLRACFLGFIVCGYGLAQAPRGSIIAPAFDQGWFSRTPISLFALGDEGLNYTWTLSTGEVLEGQSHSYEVTGTEPILITLTATNAAGQSIEPDTRWIYPFPSFEFFSLPVVQGVRASRNILRPGEPFTVSGTFVDPEDDGPFSYHWFVLGPDERPIRSNEEVFSLSLPAHPAGELYSIILVVRDAAGHPSHFNPFTSRVEVLVAEGNLPPIGKIVDPPGLLLTLNEGDTYTFRAEASDPEGDEPITYQWHGPDDDIKFGETASFQFQEVGRTAVTLVLTDSKGNTAPPQSTYIDVQEGNEIVAPDSFISRPFFSTSVAEGDPLILSGLVPTGGESFTPVWRLTNVVTQEVVSRIEAAIPGRVFFPGHGLFFLSFLLEQGAAQSPLSNGNTRWISIQARDDNRAPVWDRTFIEPTYVANGQSVTLQTLATDPDGDALTYFWSYDGKQIQGGQTQTFEVDLPEDRFTLGSSVFPISSHVVDARGKAPLLPQTHRVVVYNGRRPFTSEIEGFDDQSNLFHDIQDPLALSGTVSNGEGVDVILTWQAYYEGEAIPTPLFTATGPNVGPVSFPKPGVVNIYLSAVSADGSLNDPIGDALRVHVYDPSLLPTAVITNPITSSVEAEIGSGLTFESHLVDPNFQPALLDLGFISTLETKAVWTVSGPNGQTSHELGANQPFIWVPEVEGSYTVSLLARNELGLESASSDTRTVTVRQPLEDLQLEPNNSREEASEIALGQFSGLNLSVEDPDDWFRFQLEQSGAMLSLNLDLRRAAAPVVLSIFREEALVLRTSLANGSLHPFRFVGSSAGTYFLHVALQPGVIPKHSKMGLDFAFNVGVSTPRLTFPYPKTDEVDETTLTLTNPFGSTAQVSLSAYDEAGNRLGQVDGAIAPKGQWSDSVSNLFPGLNSLQIAWVQVSSDANIDGISLTLGRDNATAVLEPAEVGPLQELIVPHIALDTGLWYTRAALVNPSDVQVDSYFQSQSGQQDVTQIGPPATGNVLDFEHFFGGTLPADTEWGRFVERNNQPALAGMELFGTKTGSPRLAGLLLSGEGSRNPNFTYVRRDIYFPHVAKDIRTFWTGVAFVNTEEVEVGLNLVGYDDDGGVLATQSMVLAPNEKRVALARALFDDLASDAPLSWIHLQTDGNIQGYALFGDNTGANKTLAGLTAVPGGANQLRFQKLVYQPGVNWTGIAAVNLSSDTQAQITYTLYSSDGSVLGTAQDRLEPLHKRVTLIEQLFGGSLPAGAAWLNLESTQPVAAFALVGDLDGNFLAGAVAR